MFVCRVCVCARACVWLWGGLAKIQSCFTINGYPLFRQVTATSMSTHVHGSTVTLTTLTGCQAAAGLPPVAPVLPEIIHLATPPVSVAALYLVVAHWSLSSLALVVWVWCLCFSDLVFFVSLVFFAVVGCCCFCCWLFIFVFCWGGGGEGCYHMLGLASVSGMGIFSQYLH